MTDEGLSNSGPNVRIEYVIFDMDGTHFAYKSSTSKLRNEWGHRFSTKTWHRELNIPNEIDNILDKYGKIMTWEIKAGLMAERDASEHLLSFFPEIPLTVDEYMKERDIMQDVLWPTVQPLPGVVRLVKHLHAHDVPIAIATGSRRRNFLLKTGHLQELIDCFQGKVICADDGLVKHGRGKPCPDIFLAAARLLGREVAFGEHIDADLEEKIERSKGLVFEDAIPGVQAGKRAGMNVVWVPDANLLNVEYAELHRADEILHSLEEFVPEKYGLPPYNA